MKYFRVNRTRTVGIVGVLLILLSVGSIDVLSQSFGEYELKAGFIYKFISFISWPDDQAADVPITIAILGEDPFGDAFEAVAGSAVNGRAVEIKSFGRDADYEDLKRCQLIYISTSEEKRLGAIFKALENAPVLTIGDSKGFVDKGGMIGFVKKQKKRIGVEINNAAATKANLTIRSMLKRIAVRIIDEPDTNKEDRHEERRK